MLARNGPTVFLALSFGLGFLRPPPVFVVLVPGDDVLDAFVEVGNVVRSLVRRGASWING